MLNDSILDLSFAAQPTNDKLDDFIATINSALQPMFMQIRKGMSEDNGQQYFALVSRTLWFVDEQPALNCIEHFIVLLILWWRQPFSEPRSYRLSTSFPPLKPLNVSLPGLS